ncbi:MAG: AMP-binding protein [Rheinheimera sp.]|nr:AMP-binding protein [Rheinheimera sp.]
MKFPLTLAQQGIWLGQQMNGQGALYNTAECVAFAGKIDAELLVQALRQAVAEAEAVSCLYQSDADHPAGYRQPVDLPVEIDELQLDGPRDREFFEQYAREQVRQPMDLSQQLPIRFVLFRAPAHDYLFSMAHHIALDGYGHAILFRRVAAIYNALRQCTLVPACPFGSMAAVVAEEQQWQAQKPASATYWQQQFASWPAAVSFVAEQGPLQPYYRRQSEALSSAQWQQLQQLAAQHRLSWPDLLLASFSALLACYSGEHRLSLGLIMMNRIGSKALQVPCMHTNIVPLFADVQQVSLLGLAQQLARRKRELRPHQIYRYEEMKRDQRKVAERLYGPLVNIMPFDYAATYGDVPSRTLHLVTGTVEDLILEVYVEGDAPPLLDFDANPVLYSEASLAELRCLFFKLLDAQLAAPDTPLPDLNAQWLASARQESLLTATDAIAAVPEIMTQFAHQVTSRALHPAIVAGSDSVSYQQLWQQVQQHRQALQQLALPTPRRVALLLPRHSHTVALQLACLAAGHSFVPLDASLPLARLQQQLAQAMPALLVFAADTQSLAEQLAATLAAPPLLREISQLNVQFSAMPAAPEPGTTAAAAMITPVSASTEAYLQFTSGSTGAPKAVPIHRGALSHFACAAAQRYSWQATDRVLQFAPLHFDASIEEIFVSLSCGATLVLRDDEALQSMAAFGTLLEQQQISIADLPTAFFHEWVLSLQPGQPLPASLRQVIVGGEALQSSVLLSWQQVVARSAPTNTVQLLNSYGPTETTVVVLSQDVSQWQAQDPQQPDALPIGQPLPGVEALVLDRHDRPSLQGELVLLGPTVSSGYLPQPTAEAPSAARVAHQQLQIGGQLRQVYRTGDIVRLQHGLLYYCGRQDDEFKLSGYRIQPAEVEQLLCRHPAIQQAVVLGISSGQQRYLQAWLVLTDDLTSQEQAELPARLRQALALHLAPALIPSRFSLLKELPLNRNNKVDKAALRALPAGGQSQEQSPQLDGTAALVAEIWQQVLGDQPLQRHDNFFNLGGQSLQTIQVVNRLSRELDLHLKVSDAFNNPTLQQLADHLDSLQQQGSEEEMVW